MQKILQGGKAMKFEAPKIEVIRFAAEDIVTTSSAPGEWGTESDEE